MYFLRTLGGLLLERDGANVDAATGQRKALALLAFLAANGPTSRDSLLAMLWPDSDTERARNSLKQLTHLIRHQLRLRDALTGTDELRLNPDRIGSDVGEFTAALSQRDLTRAAALYKGRFLSGFHLAGNSEFDGWAAAR